MPDYVSPLYRVLQAQATLDHTRAETTDLQSLGQQRQLRGQILQEELQQTQRTTQALQRALSARPPTPLDDRTQPSPDDSPLASSEKNVRRLQLEAKEAYRLAEAVGAGGGDPDTILKLRKNATDTGYRATQALREFKEERNNSAREIGGWAQGATDADGFEMFLRRAKVNEPELLQLLPFDRSQSGYPIWGPRTESTMKTLARQSQTVTQQSQTDAKLAEIKAKEDKLALDRDNLERKKQLDVSTTALAQASIELKNAQTVAAGARAAPKPVAPANKSELNAATSAIRSEFPDAVFDASLDRFSADVADRAKQIYSDAVKNGEEADRGTAREQALEELKPFVTDREKVTREGVDLPIIGRVGREATKYKTYTRGGAGREAVVNESGGRAINSQAEYEALKPGDPYIWNGKPGVKGGKK